MAELQESLKAGFERTTAYTNPLYLKLSGNIIEALERNGVQFSGDIPPEVEAFDLLSKQEFVRKSGARVTLCRWLASLSKALSETKWWEIDCYQRTYLALEADMLGNSGLLRKLRLRAGASEEVSEAGGATGSHRITIEDRGDLKACLSNSVAPWASGGRSFPWVGRRPFREACRSSSRFGRSWLPSRDVGHCAVVHSFCLRVVLRECARALCIDVFAPCRVLSRRVECPT